MIGIEKIWEIVLDHRKKLLATGELEANRKRQAVDWMWSLIKEGLKERFYQNPDVKKMLPKIAKEVENGTTASALAANRLLFFLDKMHSV
jgi:LAO/AO transport system kinase